MYNAGHELACYQVESREWARGQNSDIKEVLQAAEWRSGNGIPGVVVTMRSRAKNLQHYFFCVQLSVLLISWWLLLLYTQNDEDGRWAKPQNDSSRIGKLVRD